jgi:ATP-binding cassette subfamily F protein 3
MLGMMASDNARGSQRLGSRVKVGYYDQQLRGVNPENTLFKEVKEYFESDQQVHDILGAYTFPYDAQYKLVKNLSGGERARLALLKLSLEKNNLLVLDEPTNHLDMEMLESLEKALLQFQGTLMMVSHDRRFIENLANQIWLLEEGEFYAYPGGWDYYKQKHKTAIAELEPETEVKVITPQKPVPKGMNPWKLKAAITELEKRIAILETEQTSITEELGNPKSNTDFAALGKRTAEIDAELLEIMTKWEENSSLLEAANSK